MSLSENNDLKNMIFSIVLPSLSEQRLVRTLHSLCSNQPKAVLNLYKLTKAVSKPC